MLPPGMECMAEVVLTVVGGVSGTDSPLTVFERGGGWISLPVTEGSLIAEMSVSGRGKLAIQGRGSSQRLG